MSAFIQLAHFSFEKQIKTESPITIDDQALLFLFLYKKVLLKVNILYLQLYTRLKVEEDSFNTVPSPSFCTLFMAV